MKIEGATILLDQLRTSELLEKADPLFQTALKMGVAALEREKEHRAENPTAIIFCFPGETLPSQGDVATVATNVPLALMQPGLMTKFFKLDKEIDPKEYKKHMQEVFDRTNQDAKLYFKGNEGSPTLNKLDKLIASVRGSKPAMLLMSRRSWRKLQSLLRAKESE